MSAAGPPAQTVRDIIEASRYLVLATADAAGRLALKFADHRLVVSVPGPVGRGFPRPLR